jgi:hypothetical protein
MSAAKEIISFCRNYEKELNFCYRQLLLLSEKSYSDDDYAVALHLRSYGCAAYCAIRQYITLPFVRTIRRLVSSVNKEGDKEYLSKVFNRPSDSKRLCVLLIDEVYVRSHLDNQGLTVYAETVDQPGALARTVLTFMIACLCAGPKFCV